MGDLDDTKKYYEKALAIRLKASTDQSKDRKIAEVYSNMGNYLMEIDQHREALTNHEKALAIYKESSNDVAKDTNVANSCNVIGVCLKATDNPKSINYFNEALQILIKNQSPYTGYGSKNIKNSELDETGAEVLCNIGLSYLETKQYRKSESYFNDAHIIYCRINQQSDMYLQLRQADVLTNIALCYIGQSRNYANDAIRKLRSALEIYNKYSQAKSSDKNVANTLYYLGLYLMYSQSYKESLEHVNEALTIYDKVPKNESVRRNVAEALHCQGVCLMNLAKYKDSMDAYRRALEIKEETSDDKTSDESIAETLEAIADCKIRSKNK